MAIWICGPAARYFVNVLQALLLLLILGQAIIQNGQGVSQVSKFRLCYAVCCVVFVVVGFFIGQVRTLRNYEWLANMAVFINVLVIFITMGVMAHSPLNCSIAKLGSAGASVDPSTVTPDPKTGKSPPIIHCWGFRNPSSLIGSLNGLLQGVFAYGGPSCLSSLWPRCEGCTILSRLCGVPNSSSIRSISYMDVTSTISKANIPTRYPIKGSQSM